MRIPGAQQLAFPDVAVQKRFALARLQPFETPTRPRADIDLRFLNDQTFASMFEFPSDTSKPVEELEINRLDNQALVRYYETEWRRVEQ